MDRRLLLPHIKIVHKQIVQSWNGASIVSLGTPQLFLSFCSIILSLGAFSPSPVAQDGCCSCSCLIHVPCRKQKEGDEGQQQRHTCLRTVPLLRNLPQSTVLQLPLTSDWPAVSHVVTLAAREAGKGSLCPGNITAPMNIRKGRKNGSQVGSWQALPRQTLELLPPKLDKMAFLS